MNANQVIETFKRTGALLEGHFILSSGLHSSIYLQCAIALESTTVAMDFGAAIAEHFNNQQIETVASPAIGGIVIGYEVARQLGAPGRTAMPGCVSHARPSRGACPRRPLSLDGFAPRPPMLGESTEREEGRMTLRRGFTVHAGEQVLVVEDVITTGGSTRGTIEALFRAGARVVAAASIINRSGGKADVGVPLVSLASLDVPAVNPSACNLCKRGEPATKPGSRKANV